MSDIISEVSLTRQELYDRVWSTPMRKLAKEFGLSDVGLAKICKRHKIPKPTCGYWAKVEHGKKVERWPLRPIDNESLSVVRLRATPQELKAPKKEVAHDPAIAALITAESLPENHIEMATDLRGADPFIVATRDSLAKQVPNDYGRISRRYDFPNPCFEVRVSLAKVQRALLLLHTLVRALKKRGYVVRVGKERSREPRIIVLEREFSLSVREPSQRKTRELTKEEKIERERFPWRVRDYEHLPTGNLELHLDRHTSWSNTKFVDTKKRPLENRLNDIVVAMLKIVDDQRVKVEQERLAAIEKAKRRKLAVELEAIRRADSVREERTLKAIPRWENAQRIKGYIEAVRAEAIRRFGVIDELSEIGRWLQWADQYFETINPFSERRELPIFSLTPEECEQLKRECDSDWSDWSETFRPRQPR